MTQEDWAARIEEALQAKARGRFLRQAALVEYRCHRGCFMGALVAVPGGKFLVTAEHVVTESAEVSPWLVELIGLGTDLRDLPRPVPPAVVEATRKVVEEVGLAKLLKTLGGDDLALPSSTLKEQFALGGTRDMMGGGYLDVTPLEEVREWMIAVDSVNESLVDKGTSEPIVTMNCWHDEMRLSWDDLEKDQEVFRGRKKRVKYSRAPKTS